MPGPLEASFHADEGWEGSDLPLPALDCGEGDVSAHGSAASSLHEGYGSGSLFGHVDTPRVRCWVLHSFLKTPQLLHRRMDIM